MVEKQLSARLKTFSWRLADYAARSSQHSKSELLQGTTFPERSTKMRRITIALAAVTLLAAASPLIKYSRAQTQNSSSKVQFNEAFVFPNECTNELMDITDVTTVTCHDQQRADGTFSEKCEIRQDVTATGETTGITWRGTGTFKDEFITTDPCNFSFSNQGKVNLISRGSAVNTIIAFDDFVRMQDCVLTDDQHVASFDCRGNVKP